MNANPAQRDLDQVGGFGNRQAGDLAQSLEFNRFVFSFESHQVRIGFVSIFDSLTLDVPAGNQLPVFRAPIPQLRRSSFLCSKEAYFAPRVMTLIIIFRHR